MAKSCPARVINSIRRDLYAVRSSLRDLPIGDVAMDLGKIDHRLGECAVSGFGGVYTGASKYPGHYWKSGHGYVPCPTGKKAKRASKAVKAACVASFSGYSKRNRRSRRVRRSAKRRG